MRFIRVSAMRTALPPATAPPESPVPAPRATKGTSSRCSSRTTSRTSPASAGHHHHAGIRFARREAIHRVGGELRPPVAYPARAHDVPERLDQGGCHPPAASSGCAPPPPVPLRCAPAMHQERLLHRARESRQQPEQRLHPSRGRPLHEQTLLDRRIAVGAGGGMEGEAHGVRREARRRRIRGRAGGAQLVVVDERARAAGPC